KRSLTARPRFGPRRPIPVSGGRQEGGGVEIFPTPPPLGTPGLRCRSRSGSVRQLGASPAEAAPPFVPGVSGPPVAPRPLFEAPAAAPRPPCARGPTRPA